MEYDHQVQAAVVEVAVGQQAQGAAVRPTGCHHHHDPLVITLRVPEHGERSISHSDLLLRSEQQVITTMIALL